MHSIATINEAKRGGGYMPKREVRKVIKPYGRIAGCRRGGKGTWATRIQHCERVGGWGSEEEYAGRFEDMT